LHDIAEFLQRHPPFSGVDPEGLEELAAAVEVEYFTAKTVIFRQAEGPMDHVWVVRRGAVELADRGHVLDLLGEGEMFGHPSMLSGLPTGLEARAREDALCYRLPATAILTYLARPAGLRYVARSLIDRPKPQPAALPFGLDLARQPVAGMIRARPVICAPGDTVRGAAARMAEAGLSATLVRLPDGGLGILTDHDLREVVAGSLPPDAPVTEAMSAPAATLGPDRLGAEAMLEMLDRGIRHMPVVSPLGEPLGVIRDVDLLAAEAGTPFALRRAVDDAGGLEELKRVARQVAPMVIAVHDAGVPPGQVGAILAVVVDALTRRLIELEVAARGAPPAPLRWLALGSLGRREVVPSSDIDSALVWDGDSADAEGQRYMSALAETVVGGLENCGFEPDAHGATGADASFARTLQGWRDGIRDAIEHPLRDAALILLSLLLDGRAVHRIGDAPDVLDELRQLRHRPALRRLMLRLALTHKPPTGFLRGFVVEGSGEHRGELDLKRGGLLPITGLARYASLAAGARATSTRERLRIAATAGSLDAAETRTLAEAYDLFSRLRLEHQVEQLRRGDKPDDYLDPDELNPLTRSYLRDAFHAVGGVQRRLTNALRFE
jgi:CBS domain-containing protein